MTAGGRGAVRFQLIQRVPSNILNTLPQLVGMAGDALRLIVFTNNMMDHYV